MLRIPILCLLAGSCLAQNAPDLFNKPPAEVDQTLRARISEFYDLHVKKQFRKAEELVAQDTKDFFYSHDKPAYLSFEIKDIKYSENFTKAKAMVICEQRVMFPGFADKPVKFPIPSDWKLENGKWVWYVDQEALLQSPFGKMSPGPAGPGGGQSTLPSSIPSDYSFIMKQVRLEKDSVELKPGQTAQVMIVNSAQGLMKVAIAGKIEGIEAKLPQDEIKAGDKVAVTLRAMKGPISGILPIRVEQTGEVLPIAVVVKAAPAPVLKQVRLEKDSVVLKPGATAQATISNSAPEPMKIAITDRIAGIEAKLAQEEIQAGEKIALTLRAGKKPASGIIHIRVEQTGEVLPIRVAVK